MPEPIEKAPPRRPARSIMMHPYVGEVTHARVAAAAAALGWAPEQLVGLILDRVFGDPQLQRLLKI